MVMKLLLGMWCIIVLIVVALMKGGTGVTGSLGGALIINGQHVIVNNGNIKVDGGEGGSGVNWNVGGYSITDTSGADGGAGFILWLADQ